MLAAVLAAVLVHAAVPNALRGERGAHEQAGHGQEQDAGDAHGEEVLGVRSSVFGGWSISNRCERAFVPDFTLSPRLQGAPLFSTLTMSYTFSL